MAVRFDRERMEQALNHHMLWWKGELDRPLTCVTLIEPGEKKTPAPYLTQGNCADFRWTPEQVIDAIDEELSRREFLGDAYPFVNLDSFGPGVLAAFCGAKLDNSSGRVWFFPDEEREIEDIHVRYDPENVYVRRIKELYRAGMERWNGTVVMGMPDLGGVLDVAATFRGSQNLLTDLYDAPDEVIRLTKEIQTAWYAAYDDLLAALDVQGCNSNWSGILSRTPSYITQCDFCYMIGNPMFRQFVLDTLRNDTQRLDHVIYHLDGVGELNHLDDVLAMEKLDAVQWVPGDGKAPCAAWMDVYRRIEQAGKQSWICGGPKDFLKIVGELHIRPYFTCALPSGERALAETLLKAR